jgi:hypothetical protein
MTGHTLSAACYLTLAGDGEKDVLRYVDGLLDSLATFWDDPEPLRLAFIAPEAELPFFYDAIGPVPGVAISFVTEAQLSPILGNDRQLPSEQREMLARLLYAASCPTDFCLTLEPRLFCIRPIGTERLLPRGRARTEWESKGRHADWWRAAARLLTLGESRESRGLGVCPAIFAKVLARNAIEAVAAASRQDAVTALADAISGETGSWTDSALYCLANEGRPLLEWHWEAGTNPNQQPNRLHSDVNLWQREDLRGWDPAGWRALASHGYFVIVDHRTGLSPDAVLPTLYKLLDLRAA